jgi:ElaB/YqjD/DUF883 family membrane-anchored ribosome-binding protein
MVNLGRAERKAAKFVKDVKDLDIDDVYDELDGLRAYVNDLSRSVGKSAKSGYKQARHVASDAAQEAEEAIRDNLAASLILAAGLGVIVGYLIGRSSD